MWCWPARSRRRPCAWRAASVRCGIGSPGSPPARRAEVWFPGIASPILAGAATDAGLRRGEAPGAWGPSFPDVVLYRALSTRALPRRTTPGDEAGLRVGVFHGPLPFGPHAGFRTVLGVGPLGEPLASSPHDAIDAWRDGACDVLRLGPYWLGPDDQLPSASCGGTR